MAFTFGESLRGVWAAVGAGAGFAAESWFTMLGGVAVGSEPFDEGSRSR